MIKECDKPRVGKGLCDTHYARLRRTGTLADPKPRPTLEERFWIKVDKDGPIPTHNPQLGQCWMWLGAKKKYGHGIFSTQWKDNKGKNQGAHRIAYNLLVGPVPDGLELDHLCRNPPCVNPAHLEPVTHAENMRRYQLSKTHCPHGHPYEGANLIVRPLGYRVCRICYEHSCRASYEKNKDKYAAQKIEKYHQTKIDNPEAYAASRIGHNKRARDRYHANWQDSRDKKNTYKRQRRLAQLDKVIDDG